MIMKKSAILMLICAVLFLAVPSAAESRFPVGGRLLDAATGEPLAGGVVSLDALWAVTGESGAFEITGVQPGRYVLKTSLLGYKDEAVEVVVGDGMKPLEVRLKPSSLALDGVTVTASRDAEAMSTSHSISRDALNHLQLSNMTDMAALLPGGKTVNPDLTTSNSFSIREGGSTAGNASFSTAVEVDGVRVGNNAGFSEPSGVDTRSIAVDNVESVEVLSGVPSAEYGDLGAGVVKVHTKTGRTPVNVTFSVNPRTWQASASKGISLGDKAGYLNLSAEWANATKKLTSPYESYTRRGLSVKYSNMFAGCLRLEAALTGNLGGMNSEDDPDAFSGAWSKVRDNVLRGSTSLIWLLNRSWITNLEFKASVNYNDNCSRTHAYNSYASSQPAVHSTLSGYYLADALPLTYYSDKVVDSRELDFAASLKYSWDKRVGECRSKLKAGVQWKANGNAGEGEYYEDPSLEPNGYRPRPYSDYPYMHNLSLYAEEEFGFPFGLTLSAGVRMENVFVRGSSYSDVTSFTPRFNARWKISDAVTVRAGWGVSEKLPSFYILYPEQQYRDIQTFGFSYGGGASYVYYTIPYTTVYNPDLKWQRNENAELGVDLAFGDFSLSVALFRNLTLNPYKVTSLYEPFSYNISRTPSFWSAPDNPQIKVDNQTGDVYVRGSSDLVWTKMDTKVTDRTFVKTVTQTNGAPITRAGAELTAEFPEIKPVRTRLRLDAAYTYTGYNDNSESYCYNNGWSHTSLPDRSYQYVGIYANGDNSSRMVSGRKTHNLDANLTSITHIKEARIIITCRLEMALLRRSLNIPAGSKKCLYPTAYMTLDGVVHSFTEADKTDPEFSSLVVYPSNDYLFDLDGYGMYASANLSVTKEIGDHVSLSVFVNNFTNSRPTVYSLATGVGAIFTPNLYYGLTCRIKI